MNLRNASHLYAFGAVFCFSALCFALFSQYVWQLLPCTFCIAQRICYALLLFIFTAGYLKTRSQGTHTLTHLSSASSAFAIAVFGLFLALYQFFVAKHSRECGISFAQHLINWTHLEQLWPWMFQVQALCADAPAQLLGIAYELYSGAGFVAISVLSAWALYVSISTKSSATHVLQDIQRHQG